MSGNARPTVRTATPGDVDTLVALERHAFGARGWSRETLRGELCHPDARVWLAEVEAEPVGHLAARMMADSCEVMTLAVAPTWRRMGAARRLVAEAIGWARVEGARLVHLEVAVDNGGARSLYEQAGFTVVGRRRGYYGPGRDALLMTLDLRRDQDGQGPDQVPSW